MPGLRSIFTPQKAALLLLWGFFAGCALPRNDAPLPMGSRKINRVQTVTNASTPTTAVQPPRSPAPPEPTPAPIAPTTPEAAIPSTPAPETPEREPKPAAEARPLKPAETEPPTPPVATPQPVAQVVRLGPEQIPQPIVAPVPVFPRYTKLEQIAGGSATFLISVNQQGEVTGAQLIETSHPELVEPSRTALLKRHYQRSELPQGYPKLTTFQFPVNLVF
ncbi:MAG: hypothetical protein E1N59_2640 [Puniceicoccaceae bacterium 5H]|nr:MAG: hypothetical protein E1N59_2640 [Puniceicoccaceae bacterium 5H]